MKLLIIIAVLLFACTTITYAKTWVVDQNGLGDYTSISSAINVAKPGDIVKVNPGIYEEKIILNKNIIVEGSGAESTTISYQEKDYAVEITDGRIRWFAITSAYRGIYSKGGTVSNCVIKDCSSDGVFIVTGGKILNSISMNNNNGFITIKYHSPIITNCISYQNNRYGFATREDETGSYSYRLYNVEYCNAYGNKNSNFYDFRMKETGTLEVDPKFEPDNYQISSGSPCRNAGNPAYLNPDGTRADMGYYGGPDAPTFPVMRQSLIKLNEDGTIQLEALGISPY